MTPTQQHLLSLFTIDATGIMAPRELYVVASWPKLLTLPEDRDWSAVTSAAITRMNSLARAQPVQAPPLNSVPRKPQPAPRIDAVAECKRLGLKFTPHPTNSGMTAMRARNALNVYLRKAKQ